ncbi:CYTH and CHAD domain-containing protein [Piscinibacter sp.]|uniref:CYTH and CHAD domain-containing protein n=1 Tax=Piscinibacter sp. TaxID=1903157 RepID=UPI002BEFE133|nr:CYTH and CHAD domain-containing protein [Albitalea sp.]HUG25588.1 CYTH and CHAD domain-containing protein [Albitalea sp.]
MQETELKLQVPATRRAAIDKALRGRESAPRLRLQATYFDTADRALAQAGLALRVRREGRGWVQTLKGKGSDGLTRSEHNVPLPAGTASADPALHAGTPAGDRLRAVLDESPAPALLAQFTTDVLRRARQVRTREGTVELAFDEGAIVAGDRRMPVSELEIELVSGSPLAVVATARRWVLRHGLWLDTRTKAERGGLLARGETMAPHRTAQPVEMAPDMSPAQALRCVLLSCLDQIAANASQVASGPYGDEHVHQLRIGLRRLRSALRLFPDVPVSPGLDEQATALFRRLGAARDQAAVALPLQRELNRVAQAAGLDFEVPVLPGVDGAAEPAFIVRLGPAQGLLLDLFALTQADVPAPADGEPVLRDVLTRRLNGWHRKVMSDAARFASLDDAARHAMRKRAKRLRYGAEFSAALFKRQAVKRYLKPLRELQERLGAIVDTMVALDAYRPLAGSDQHALFALGWLAAREEVLVQGSAPAMKAFREARRFWKN